MTLSPGAGEAAHVFPFSLVAMDAGMDIWFELWDSDSANLIGSYATEQDTRRFLGPSLEVHGTAAFAGLVLTQEMADRDEPRVIAAGADLVRYLQASTPR